MMYFSPDGRTFSSYTGYCDHIAYLSFSVGDLKSHRYWKEEKEKMLKKQRSIGARIFLFFLLPVTIPICVLAGRPLNAFRAVFGKD